MAKDIELKLPFVIIKNYRTSVTGYKIQIRKSNRKAKTTRYQRQVIMITDNQSQTSLSKHQQIFPYNYEKTQLIPQTTTNLDIDVQIGFNHQAQIPSFNFDNQIIALKQARIRRSLKLQQQLVNTIRKALTQQELNKMNLLLSGNRIGLPQIEQWLSKNILKEALNERWQVRRFLAQQPYI